MPRSHLKELSSKSYKWIGLCTFACRSLWCSLLLILEGCIWYNSEAFAIQNTIRTQNRFLKKYLKKAFSLPARAAKPSEIWVVPYKWSHIQVARSCLTSVKRRVPLRQFSWKSWDKKTTTKNGSLEEWASLDLVLKNQSNGQHGNMSHNHKDY